MPPSLALFLWFIFLVTLFRFEPAKAPRTSLALWVPVISLFFLATRLPSQWFGGQMGQAAQALEDRNPLTAPFFHPDPARNRHPDIAFLQMGHLLRAKLGLDCASFLRPLERFVVRLPLCRAYPLSRLSGGSGTCAIIC
jgi:hypothetical protein